MAQIYKIDTDQGQQRRQEDSRIRLSVARNIPEWDEEWGGESPWRQPDPEMDKLRRKAGLKELHPPPWYKRIARFYDENWEYIFEGVGPAIIFLAVFSIMALIIVNLGRATGWWGGAMVVNEYKVLHVVCGALINMAVNWSAGLPLMFNEW